MTYGQVTERVTMNKAGANFKVNHVSEMPQNPKLVLRFHKINRAFTDLNITETLRDDIIPLSKEQGK